MADTQSSASIQAANAAPASTNAAPASTVAKPTLVSTVETKSESFVKKYIGWFAVAAVAILIAVIAAAVL